MSDDLDSNKSNKDMIVKKSYDPREHANKLIQEYQVKIADSSVIDEQYKIWLEIWDEVTSNNTQQENDDASCIDIDVCSDNSCIKE